MSKNRMTYNIFEDDWWWGHSTVFIASDGKSIIDLSVNKEYPEHGCLRCLMVHNSVRHQGRATEIMKIAEKEAQLRGLKYTFLDVNKSQWLKEWYERLGYEVTRENEESKGQTVSMTKKL